MVVNATYNNIFSYIMAVSFIGWGDRSTWGNHWHVGSHWQTLSHNVVSGTPAMSRIQTHNVSGDRVVVK